MTACCDIQKKQDLDQTARGSDRGTHAECDCNEATYRPVVDIIEKAGELLLVAEVPGASAEDIDISFDRGELTVCAKVAPRLKEGARPLLREYGVGSFCRTFRIGEDIDVQQIAGETRHGVLTLRLPKRASVLPRKIAVKSA
ncbi:MAG: Hsp20/alpha crystallin family protein [Phycisphaerales bacterium]|nr:Hsp20/alpha crystallin family protein [Phycisphaerales bacterium]